MEEARRFLRYVIPGLIFFIEVSLYLFLTADKAFIAVLREWSKSLAFPVAALFASGGVGFLLGVIYHTLYWTWGFRSLAVSHLPLLKDCEKKGWFRLERRDNDSELHTDALTQQGAWRVVTAFWHERRECSKRIKSADPRTNSLTDIMHGLGAAFIGSVLAIPLWLYINNIFFKQTTSSVTFIIPLVVVFFHFVNFRRVVKDCQSIVDIIVADQLAGEYESNKAPIVLYVSASDIVNKPMT